MNIDLHSKKIIQNQSFKTRKKYFHFLIQQNSITYLQLEKSRFRVNDYCRTIRQFDDEKE